MIIHDIEQGTPEWHKLRAGLPTGSEFSRIITGTGKTSDSLPDYAFDLALELFTGRPLDDAFSGNQHTKRGHNLEPAARASYEFVYDCEITQVGFVTDDAITCGVSPDGFIGKDGLFEAKCLSDKEHIKLLMYHKKNGKAPAKYLPQCQGQMHVCERDYCDLYFYHPEFRCLRIRQEPDKALVQALKKQILAVCAERNIILNELRELAA
ncbi:MAG TPA: hypothetical protein ENK38_01955 [Gammaproteobacteria bacterium]|nr:hypothetical protein [Gammaproteobacteria bacterium]